LMLPDECRRAASSIAGRLRIKSVEARIVEEASREVRPAAGRRVEILVKDSLLPSVDERESPFLAVVPSLLAIGLASRLPPSVIEVLERSYVLEVAVDFRNLLYLPVPEVNDVIEIVGKKNSAASYDRIRRLEEIAGSRGIKVRGHTLLNSNHGEGGLELGLP